MLVEGAVARVRKLERLLACVEGGYVRRDDVALLVADGQRRHRLRDGEFKVGRLFAELRLRSALGRGESFERVVRARMVEREHAAYVRGGSVARRKGR